ncbi:shTK domain protein [Ancylostoma ceylanicum]|uniref:ShTK domain protein n=1 Tax=Ancylostoma ceylanicum TaxID=53326 RepID=A0A0D6MA23_9BILA|nr:shTK domain protein [Ancylostoma ceylanicum]
MQKKNVQIKVLTATQTTAQYDPVMPWSTVRKRVEIVSVTFCHNSHFVSCKESRKPECDSLLKDYCPLLCGACRPWKKKSSKGKGAKSMSRSPLSIANLGILKEFSKSKQMPPEISIQRPTLTPVTPAAVGPSNSSSDASAENTAAVFRTPHMEEAMYPDPFVESAVPTSTPIIADEEDSGIESEWMEQSALTELNATLVHPSLPPEPMRILSGQLPSQRPPPHWERPPKIFTSPRAHGPPEQGLTQRRYHPAHRSAQWTPEYPEYPQPYPPFSFASPPMPFSRALYSPAATSARLEGIQEPPLGFGDLVTLLGLQCLDSIKLDCAEVQRLGGCKLPTAAEYCPRTCRLCALPAAIAETLPPCKDELDTCENLAESGVCEHPYSRKALRIYCAKSCGFCREPQYYMNDAPYLGDAKARERL